MSFTKEVSENYIRSRKLKIHQLSNIRFYYSKCMNNYSGYPYKGKQYR